MLTEVLIDRIDYFCFVSYLLHFGQENCICRFKLFFCSRMIQFYYVMHQSFETPAPPIRVLAGDCGDFHLIYTSTCKWIAKCNNNNKKNSTALSSNSRRRGFWICLPTDHHKYFSLWKRECGWILQHALTKQVMVAWPPVKYWKDQSSRKENLFCSSFAWC